MAQRANEGLGSPVRKWCVIDKECPARALCGAQPVVLAMFVLTEVSTMNANLSKWLAMKGCRFAIQMRLRSATSLRFCSSA